MRIKWTEELKGVVKNLVIKGKTNIEIAEYFTRLFGKLVSVSTIENVRKRYGMNQNLICGDPSIKVYDDFLRLSADERWLICCDIHAPFHSVEWINRTLLVADREKCDHILIAGDLFEMGFAKHWLAYEGEQDMDFAEEMEGLEQIFKWLDYFKKIYLIRGNHESRVTRLQEAKIQAGGIIKLMTEKVYGERFRYSYYDKAEIGEDWLAVHPKSYSQISASTAVRLAEKFHKHIFSAHGHFQAFRWDRSGNHMGIDLGNLIDKNRIGYINLCTTTHPVWNNGFATLVNNHVNLYGNHTDFSRF